ncbi:MAG: hypothetical protein CVU98_11620 [Firmicutes bacterium HGW-Firmicutes-3]|nr:MAG: hypothetical protein CVU98_11620 [Firmicutes bacterium HGW-Firmicutes-3]
MSIRIDNTKCIKCRACLAICPGDLIEFDEILGATMDKQQRCWGCTACMKMCTKGAIELVATDYKVSSPIIEPDDNQTCHHRMSTMTTQASDDKVTWTITKTDGEKIIIETLKSESNQY